jgi:hypothetical protein
MAFTIKLLMESPGANMFYNPEFRHILEMHMNQLRTLYAVRHVLTPAELYQFEGDFSGFLLSKGHTLETHWLFTRVNGMTNPNQFGRELRDPLNRAQPTSYIEPHPEAIAELQQYFITLKR